MKWKKDDLAKKKGMENSSEMFIETLIDGGLSSMLEDLAGYCSGFEGTEIPKRSVPRIKG